MVEQDLTSIIPAKVHKVAEMTVKLIHVLHGYENEECNINVDIVNNFSKIKSCSFKLAE